MTKQELRAQIAQDVKALPEEYCCQADAAICRHILDSQLYRNAHTIFCYVGNDREIDTTALLRTALADGKTVATPLCVGKGIMEARQILSLDDLVSGRFNILAPKSECPRLVPEEFDLAIVPCSTGNSRGQRMGYGGGFYDRYLPGTRCPRILLCRSRLVREDIPLEEHDLPMDYLATEDGIVACSQG